MTPATEPLPVVERRGISLEQLLAAAFVGPWFVFVVVLIIITS